jgi:hypothetical protein
MLFLPFKHIIKVKININQLDPTEIKNQKKTKSYQDFISDFY